MESTIFHKRGVTEDTGISRDRMGIEMNTAIIIAAGVGHRTGQHVPKQFINVFDKPIIIYILEKFQNSKK